MECSYVNSCINKEKDTRTGCDEIDWERDFNCLPFKRRGAFENLWKIIFFCENWKFSVFIDKILKSHLKSIVKKNISFLWVAQIQQVITAFSNPIPFHLDRHSFVHALDMRIPIRNTPHSCTAREINKYSIAFQQLSRREIWNCVGPYKKKIQIKL